MKLRSLGILTQAFLVSIFLTVASPCLAATKGGRLRCAEILSGELGTNATSFMQGRQIMGNSIFDAFTFLPKTAFDGTGSKIDLNQRYQLTISSYWPTWAGKYRGSFAIALNDKQSGYNAIYLRVDEQYIVREMEVVGDTAHASVAISSLSNLPGFTVLRDELQVPTTSRETLSRVDAATREEQTSRARRNSVTPLLELQLPTIMDSDNAISVGQGEYALLRFDSTLNQTALKTFGAGPCVIVALYQRNARAGIIMHVDALTDFEQSMQNIAFRISRYDLNFNQSWDLAIIGGDHSSRENIFQIRRTLGRYGFNLMGQNVLTGKTENAWLDLETGGLYQFTANPNLKSNKNSIMPAMFRRPLSPSANSN